MYLYIHFCSLIVDIAMLIWSAAEATASKVGQVTWVSELPLREKTLGQFWIQN